LPTQFIQNGATPKAVGVAASAGRRWVGSSCGLEEGLSQIDKTYCLGCFLGVLSQTARIRGFIAGVQEARGFLDRAEIDWAFLNHFSFSFID